ncbi:MAG: heme-dependent oxidative N-demethylase subunit alpha family protein, partial [Actinomycetota bacterium]
MLQPVEKSGGVKQLLLTSAVVCCPTRWMLAEKKGQDIIQVHVPVAKYGQQVGTA